MSLIILHDLDYNPGLHKEMGWVKRLLVLSEISENVGKRNQLLKIICAGAV